MTTKRHNLPEFSSEKFIRWAEQTTSHHVVRNQYWGKTWFRKATYHLIFTYLISQAKYVATDKLRVGQCSIGTNELARLFDIPRSTINDILHFLENEGEITLKPTNRYTIVTVNYLSDRNDVSSNNLQSPTSKTQKPDIKTQKTRHQNTVVSNSDSMSYENEVKELRHQNTKSPTSKHEKSDTPIYDIVNDINDLVKIEILPENNKNSNEENNNMSSKNKVKVNALFEEPEDVSNISVKPAKEKPPNIPFIMLNIWCEEYLLNRNLKFPVQKDKDLKGCKKLLEDYRKESPNATLDDIKTYFRDFFKKVLAIKNNNYVYLKAAPMFIWSERVQINLLINQHKKSSSSVGQAHAGGNYDLPLI